MATCAARPRAPHRRHAARRRAPPRRCAHADGLAPWLGRGKCYTPDGDSNKPRAGGGGGGGGGWAWCGESVLNHCRPFGWHYHPPMTTDTDSSGNSSESGGSGDGSGGRPAQLVVELHPPRLEPPAAYTVAIELLRSYEGFGRVRAKIAPLDAGEPEPPAVVLDAHWTNLRSVPGEFALEGVRVRGPFRVTLTPVDAAKVAATIAWRAHAPDDARVRLTRTFGQGEREQRPSS